MYKVIAIKLVFLSLICMFLNFVYSKWFYERDIQKYADIIQLVRKIPNDADIIYIGESSNITCHNKDHDTRSISDFVGAYYPNLKTYDITKPASHAGIYKVLLQNIPKENKVKTVVVTLNLRSFNAQWVYSDLETPLQKSIVLLKDNPPLINKFILSFKGYDLKNEKERKLQYKSKWKNDLFQLPFEFPYKNVKEWDSYVWKNGVLNADGSRNEPLKELSCHYIKGYAFQIDTNDHPRINDFNEIVELATERNWNLVFNLLAENTDKAKELLGDDLMYFIDYNTSLLMDYYENKGVTVVNNMKSVRDDQFIDQHWTTEHYAQKGRKIIANNVAYSLKKWHKQDYKEVDLINDYSTNFTLSTTTNNNKPAFYSNIKDNKLSENSISVGNGKDYSPALEYPIKTIPDSLKNVVKIELDYIQKTLHHKSNLVIQASGTDFKDYWLGIDLKEDTSIFQAEKNFTKSIPIPDSIKNANIFKVYVFNTSEEEIYIESFKIKFE